MRRIGLLLLSVFSAAAYAQADEQQERKTAFSLKEAQEYALKNGFTVQQKEIEYEKAQKTIAETRAIGLPQVSAGFDWTNNLQLQKQPLPEDLGGGFVAFGTKYQNVASISANQLIFDGSYFVALQASKVVKRGTRYDVEISEIDIKRDVAQAYYGVLVTEETIDIIKENLESLQKNFEETRALYDNGFVEEQDADQLELLVRGLENNLNRTQRQYAIAKMLLNFNMGRYVETEIELTDEIEDLMVTEEVIQENAFSLDANVNFKYVQTVEQGAVLSVKNEKWTYAPKVSFFARHGQANFQNTFDDVWSFNQYWVPNSSIGLSLQWNILEGLRRPATVEKAKLDLEKARLNRRQVGNQLTYQYEQAKAEYEYAFDNYNIEKRNVELSKSIRDKMRVKYQEGIASSLDLTQAENQYFDVQRNYLNALQNLLNAKENLDAAIGQP